MNRLFLALLVLIFHSCVRTESEMASLRLKKAQDDWTCLASTPSLSGQILNLEQIIERVLDRNLDLLVKAKELEYQYELATGAKYKMIPPLILTGELSGRNRNTGLSSQSLVPNIPPAPPSISSEQHVNRYDLTLTWNLLDFGISFFRARQEADKTNMKQMEYLRMRLKVIQDTVKEYWRAQAALLGIQSFRELVQEENVFMDFLNKQMDAQVLARDKVLYSERRILRQEIQIQFYQREYNEAKQELAKLMGGIITDFEILQEEPEMLAVEIPEPEVLEELALLNRPELYGLDMEEKAVRDEAYIAFIQMFPSLAGFAGRFFDSNKFLIFHRWIYAGLRYTWNLLAVPSHMQDYFSELQHQQVIQYERLALSVGVLTQVNLAWIDYQNSRLEFDLISQLAEVNRHLVQAVNLRLAVGELSAYDVLVEYKYDAILSQVEALRAYGDMRTAMEQINTSIGIPFYLNDPICIEETIKNERLY